MLVILTPLSGNMIGIRIELYTGYNMVTALATRSLGLTMAK